MSNATAISAPVRAIAPVDDAIWADEQLWQLVSSGNLRGMSAKQKVAYYRYRCQQSGLNPATQPYAYMVLDGVEQLYARKACADQLRKVHGVSIVSVKCTRDDDYIEFEVTVRDRDGREDFDIGVVAVGDMKGPQRAAKKKVALTQAKRRATLSLCGEGILDESEVTELPGASTRVAEPDADAFSAVAGWSETDEDDEILDADTDDVLVGQATLPDEDVSNGVDMISSHQRGEVLWLAEKLAWVGDDEKADLRRVDAFCGEITGISSLKNLSAQRAGMVIAAMREQLPKMGKRS